MSELTRPEALEKITLEILQYEQGTAAEISADREAARLRSIGIRAKLRELALREFPLLFPFMEFETLEWLRTFDIPGRIGVEADIPGLAPVLVHFSKTYCPTGDTWEVGYSTGTQFIEVSVMQFDFTRAYNGPKAPRAYTMGEVLHQAKECYPAWMRQEEDYRKENGPEVVTTDGGPVMVEVSWEPTPGTQIDPASLPPVDGRIPETPDQELLRAFKRWFTAMYEGWPR